MWRHMNLKRCSLENDIGNLDAQRWLMSNGILTDLHKDNLFVYGAILHPGIVSVELDVDVENKHLSYRLYITKALARVLAKYNKYNSSRSIWSLFWLRRLLKKEGNLELYTMLKKFIVSYCGSDWGVKMVILDESQYNPNSPEEAQLQEEHQY